MARTYDESVKYLMEKGGLTEAEAKARLDGLIKAPAPASAPSARPTPAVNGAAAARPLAPTPSQTAAVARPTNWTQPTTPGPYTGPPILPPGAIPDQALRAIASARAGRPSSEPPGKYTNVADIRRLDSERALKLGMAMASAMANPSATVYRDPEVRKPQWWEREGPIPLLGRKGGDVRMQAVADLERHEKEFAEAPARRAAAAEAYERSLAAKEVRLQAARRAAEGRPSDYYDPEPSKTLVPAPAPVAAKPAPAPAPAPAAASAVTDADYGPGLKAADAKIRAWSPDYDFSAPPEDRLRMAASLKDKP